MYIPSFFFSNLEGFLCFDDSLRDPSLKKRGLCRVSMSPSKDIKYGRIVEDGENQNPNFLTPPPNYKSKSMKDAIKSSAEKKTMDESNLKKKKKEEQPRSLRSTLSARNLFAGGDILNKVTEFCNELKKLAMRRSKDRENVDGHLVENNKLKNNVSKNLCHEQKDRKPLLEATSPENCSPQQKRILQEKVRRKK